MGYSASVQSAPGGGIRPSILLAVLALLLLVGNLLHFLSRSWEASFYPASYATIYYPTDRPVITNWQHVADGVQAEVRWDVPGDGWKLYRDGELVSENSGKTIFFPVDENHSNFDIYTVVPNPENLCPPFDVKLRHFSRKINHERGFPRSAYTNVMTDAPMANFKQYPVSHWVDTFDYLDAADLEEVATILTQEAGIRDTDTTLEKLEKLMVHQRTALTRACRGVPPPDFRWKHPYAIYKQMRDGTGQGWCTQQAQVFSFLANRSGLSTRLVQGARTQGNDFIFTGHTWVEAWIPEQARWAWVEPSYAVIYATDKKGQVLNTVELANLRQHAAWDGVTSRVYKDWGWAELEGETGLLVDAPFSVTGDVVERQFITSAIYKWRRPPHVEDLRNDYGMLFRDWTFAWGNFVRYYFRPPLAYANYPTDGARTYLIRHLLLWGFVVTSIASLCFFFKESRTCQ